MQRLTGRPSELLLRPTTLPRSHPSRHNVPAVGNGAPSIPVPADPPPEASSLTVAGSVRCSTLGPGPIHMWASFGAAGAERAEGRSGAPSGAGKAARRSGAQPGA
jgi:hypothetical protein